MKTLEKNNLKTSLDFQRQSNCQQQEFCNNSDGNKSRHAFPIFL